VAFAAAGRGCMASVVYPRPVKRKRPAGITPCRALTFSPSSRHYSVPARIAPYCSASAAHVWQVATTTYWLSRRYAVAVGPTAPHFERSDPGDRAGNVAIPHLTSRQPARHLIPSLGHTLYLELTADPFSPFLTILAIDGFG
jgi:hypothetical protein